MKIPLGLDVQVQQSQQEKMEIMSSLTRLSPQFEIVKSKILSSVDICSLHEVFTRFLCIDSSVTSALSVLTSDALVSWNRSRGAKLSNQKGSNKSSRFRGSWMLLLPWVWSY